MLETSSNTYYRVHLTKQDRYKVRKQARELKAAFDYQQAS